MKVIIAGSREITNKELVFHILDSNKSHITEVVCGMARGIDLFGKEWAIKNNIPVAEFPADWKGLGRKAGPIRNCQMAEYADALIAIWDGNSKGTKHMIDYATKKGLKVGIKIIKIIKEN